MATLNLRQNENVSPSQVMIFINLEIQRHLSDKESVSYTHLRAHET